MGSRLWRRLTTKFTIGDDCWDWIAGVDGSGYGQLGAYRPDGAKTSLKAHRVIYEHLVGPIPEGLELDHLCRNRRCVRPSHLEPVTHAENVRRGQAGAHHAAKTHCPQGHEYSPENTLVRKDRVNRRDCRKCNAASHARWVAKRKVENIGLE